MSKVQFQIVRCSWWQCCNSRCQIPLQFWARVRSDSQFWVRTNPRFPTSDCRSRLCQDCLVIGRRVGRVWGEKYKSRVKSRIWTAFLSSWLSWSWQKSWYSWYEHVTKTHFVTLCWDECVNTWCRQQSANIDSVPPWPSLVPCHRHWYRQYLQWYCQTCQYCQCLYGKMTILTSVSAKLGKYKFLRLTLSLFLFYFI